jgi:signal transduction histidine kinase
MELITKERERLLQRTARLVVLCGSAVALACLSLPGLLPIESYLSLLPLFAVLVLAAFGLTGRFQMLWIVAGLGAGLGILVIAANPSGHAPHPALATSLAPLVAGGLAGFAVLLASTLPRIMLLVIGATASTLLVGWASVDTGLYSSAAMASLTGWILLSFVGVWITHTVPRAARRIHNIGRAHRAERQASETEAQRRQGARLLHDTVLATLTLLAHSGVGVSKEALAQQAADDARLLRQLRLGATPVPTSSGQYQLESVEDTVLGTTLESVKHRFGRMGLEVSWHGTGQVLLPSHVLDAFLLALAECLENVRRHSGVTQAHVTITEDDTTVRAMVTDSGVGFELHGIDEHKLGFRESVVGRLREVGGNARLFSTPGQGTTVVLEVPR